jgi:hypothetical protein
LEKIEKSGSEIMLRKICSSKAITIIVIYWISLSNSLRLSRTLKSGNIQLQATTTKNEIGSANLDWPNLG